MDEGLAAIVVCGGGPVGLCTAMLLARDGHDVTAFERDGAAPPGAPGEAWDRWDRRGVAQFHQPHILLPPVRLILEDELPELVDALSDAGCVWMDALALMPPSIVDRSPRPGDDRFRMLTGRRPIVEDVLAKAAEAHDGVVIRRGVGVAGLVTGRQVVAGVPNVTGVRTSDGRELGADLVIDAMGRRTRLPEWLVDVGGTPPFRDAEDCRFVYYTRYFKGSAVPPVRGPLVAEMETFSLLTLPGDNGTWSVTVWAAAADHPLKRLRDPERFANVVREMPLYRHWLHGEPITDVLAMAGVVDRYHRYVVGGRPVATGVAAVGDSWACTNPSAGRGIAVGLIHAQALRDVVRSAVGDPAALVRTWDEVTETRIAPFYWDQIQADRVRIAEMDAQRAGREPPPVDQAAADLFSAAMHDPDVLRGLLEIRMCLALPDEVYARPGFTEKVERWAGSGPGFTLPGPDRARLLELLA